MRKPVVMRVLPRWRPGRKHIAAALVALTGVLATASCTTPLPPDGIQRDMFDRAIASAQIQTTVDLYNRHIAGKFAGAVDATVSCSEGGTARIAGTVTNPAGVTALDLTYDLNACHMALSRPVPGGTSHSSLRTTGVIRKTANFSAATNTASYQSVGNLAVSGTLNIFINSVTQLQPSIEESCAFAATTTSAQVNGTYCGRPFSY